MLKHNLADPPKQHELLKWYDVITNQNYFTNEGGIIIKQGGLAMGALSSG